MSDLHRFRENRGRGASPGRRDVSRPRVAHIPCALLRVGKWSKSTWMEHDGTRNPKESDRFCLIGHLFYFVIIWMYFFGFRVSLKKGVAVSTGGNLVGTLCDSHSIFVTEMVRQHFPVWWPFRLLILTLYMTFGHTYHIPLGLTSDNLNR